MSHSRHGQCLWAVGVSLMPPALAHGNGSGDFRQSCFRNNPLIKNKKSFWVPPFDRKRRRLLKLFRKSFT
ncbi:hypothetical protein, partial [Novacetimonas hansenii]|uniref:hypothetical protein n=1 Tax=Novacetimonas hansenii TaxID=436 RepID=UPI00248D9004